MNYLQYYPTDVVNGEGTRCTLFVSGCTHGCRGCYNQKSWSFDNGVLFDEAMEQQIINDLKDTRIKRQGLTLSGGEQRRLGLARILLNDAPILLLDEPTEGLDRETERQILRLILAHAENKTLIMVTHRLTAIEQFDELYVIDEAKLIEKGTYAELLQLEKGFFKQLVERV